jgi:Ca-activated chloride channel family protein
MLAILAQAILLPLYEITPAGSDAKMVDDLRYGEQKKAVTAEKEKAAEATNEYAFVKIRYKLPDGDTSKLITTPVDDKVESKEFSAAPQEARFATAVAAYAQLLRGDPYTQSFSYDDVMATAPSSSVWHASLPVPLNYKHSSRMVMVAMMAV